jgi:Sigma-70, non-essential region
VKSLRLNQARIDALVEQLYDINKRLVGYEGRLMRLAEGHGVAREDFLKNYQGSELDPRWLNPTAKPLMMRVITAAPHDERELPLALRLRRCKPLFRGASRMSAGRQLCFHQSGLRKVTWHLPLELGEITRDRRHVEASEDRFLWLSVEQELEGGLETMLWRMLDRRQAFRTSLATW